MLTKESLLKLILKNIRHYNVVIYNICTYRHPLYKTLCYHLVTDNITSLYKYEGEYKCELCDGYGYQFTYLFKYKQCNKKLCLACKNKIEKKSKDLLEYICQPFYHQFYYKLLLIREFVITDVFFVISNYYVDFLK